MKYRCKIKNPWGDVGAIIDDTSYFGVGAPWQTAMAYKFDLKNYPDIFEPVEEESDSFLITEVFSDQTPDCNWEAIDLVEWLLSSKAINPEFLAKLRGEQK